MLLERFQILDILNHHLQRVKTADAGQDCRRSIAGIISALLKTELREWLARRTRHQEHWADATGGEKLKLGW